MVPPIAPAPNTMYRMRQYPAATRRPERVHGRGDAPGPVVDRGNRRPGELVRAHGLFGHHDVVAELAELPPDALGDPRVHEERVAAAVDPRLRDGLLKRHAQERGVEEDLGHSVDDPDAAGRPEREHRSPVAPREQRRHVVHAAASRPDRDCRPGLGIEPLHRVVEEDAGPRDRRRGTEVVGQGGGQAHDRPVAVDRQQMGRRFGFRLARSGWFGEGRARAAALRDDGLAPAGRRGPCREARRTGSRPMSAFRAQVRRSAKARSDASAIRCSRSTRPARSRSPGYPVEDVQGLLRSEATRRPRDTVDLPRAEVRLLGHRRGRSARTRRGPRR